MIPANELRIGNKVLRIKTNTFFTIIPIDISTIANGDLAVTGIPLTPEILGKCKNIDNFPYELFWNGREYHIALENGDWVFIKSLHHFQNITFALTGTELEINL